MDTPDTAYTKFKYCDNHICWDCYFKEDEAVRLITFVGIAILKKTKQLDMFIFYYIIIWRVCA